MAPRTQAAGNPSLRNRNRVTNKTRLKVIKGNIDADPIVLDEDEERARVVSTAGVDAEDANEHHLQAVLSAASHRASVVAQRAIAIANGEKKKGGEAPPKSSTAYIPTPDAAGIVEHWEELYPAGRWKDPSSYVKFSYTVEEALERPLNDGYTYVMDERDLEWLEKNNQEARGEGTSSQVAPASGTTTRSGGGRTSKGKGKESEASVPVHISEDDFELVMGLFEKLTHDKTPFLHVSFQQQQGNSIPPFSDYNDDFSIELSHEHFVGYLRPSFLPTPATLVRMAKAVYPHWRDRRTDREGHRIIPVLNFDESDIKNESYICFRRRDTKAIRKTRAAQISSAEKLSRLRGEIGQAMELARSVLAREVHKKETYTEAQAVWEKRHAFVDLKRKFPALGGREEEDLLFDKERIPKKPKTAVENVPVPPVRLPKRIADASASPAPVEPQMRPKDRFNNIQQNLEVMLKKMKDQDHGWEDHVDTAYQPPLPALGDRFFRPIVAESQSRARQSHFLRIRVGRGGRMHFDRRHLPTGRPHLVSADNNHPKLPVQKASDATGADVSEDAESESVRSRRLLDDRLDRISERWRYDCTGETVGADEEDRVLFDDFNPKHMRFQTQFSLDTDSLVTDSRLYLFDSQAGMHNYVQPIKNVYSAQSLRRDGAYQLQQLQRAPPAVSTQVAAPSNPSVSAPPLATSPHSNPHSPVKTATAPPVAIQHTRTPSNGPQRPSSSASMNGVTSISGTSASPVNNTAVTHANGLPTQAVQAVQASMPVANADVQKTVNVSSNGLNLGSQFNLNNLTPQQLQYLAQQKNLNLQKHHASLQQRNGQTGFSQQASNGVGANENMVNMNGTNFAAPVNMNLKLPPQRQMQQMQWNASQRNQAMQQMTNGDIAAALQGIQNMPNFQQFAALGFPTNNVNGHLSPARNAHSPPNSQGHASISPLIGNSPHVQPVQQQNHVSPQRNMQTPVPPSPSPLLQQLPPNLVGNVTSQNQGF